MNPIIWAAIIPLTISVCLYLYSIIGWLFFELGSMNAKDATSYGVIWELIAAITILVGFAFRMFGLV